MLGPLSCGTCGARSLRQRLFSVPSVALEYEMLEWPENGINFHSFSWPGDNLINRVSSAP